MASQPPSLPSSPGRVSQGQQLSNDSLMRFPRELRREHLQSEAQTHECVCSRGNSNIRTSIYHASHTCTCTCGPASPLACLQVQHICFRACGCACVYVCMGVCDACRVYRRVPHKIDYIVGVRFPAKTEIHLYIFCLLSVDSFYSL